MNGWEKELNETPKYQSTHNRRRSNCDRRHVFVCEFLCVSDTQHVAMCLCYACEIQFQLDSCIVYILTSMCDVIYQHCLFEMETAILTRRSVRVLVLCIGVCERGWHFEYVRKSAMNSTIHGN